MIINGLTVLIVALAGVAWVLVAVVVLRRWDGSHEPPRRSSPRSGARGTRTRRFSPARLCRRVRATIRNSTGWARHTIRLRIHGIEIDVTASHRGDAQGRDVPVCATDPGPAPGADLTGSVSPRPPREGAQVASTPLPAPTRKATEDERRDARLDYAPAAPFTDCLSDDTIARGMAAIRVEGDADMPLSAPREWHAEMENQP